MPIVIGGASLILIGVALLIARQLQQRKLQRIRSARRHSIHDLSAIASSQPGSFNQLVEVNGTIDCDVPLIADLSKRACVYYETSIVRKYKETYFETDSKTGDEVGNTREGMQRIASTRQSIPFFVEDATGRILIDPEGSEIDSIKTVDWFHQGELEWNGDNLSIEGYTFTAQGFSPSEDLDKETVGYQKDEAILPLGQNVYVLGEASNFPGELVIRSPQDGTNKFIISIKREDELVRSVGSRIRWMLAGALACDAVGVGLLLVGALALH